mmetsp:Transcript_21634/g.63524  ORF Transcript_21634/g.63524 Transcript_21634/m.63524 type:complete len:233 (-) Transcript_21634:154-852(-)
MSQYLACLGRQWLSLLAHRPTLLPSHQHHSTIVHLHGHTQLTELLHHAHGMIQYLRGRHRYRAGRDRSRPGEIVVPQLSKVSLHVGARTGGEEQPHAARGQFRHPPEIVGVLVLRGPSQRELKELVLSQKDTGLGRLLLRFAAVLVHGVRGSASGMFGVGIAKVRPHVLELVGAHILVREEIQRRMIVDRRADVGDDGRLVFPRLFRRLGQVDERGSLGPRHGCGWRLAVGR